MAKNGQADSKGFEEQMHQQYLSDMKNQQAQHEKPQKSRKYPQNPQRPSHQNIRKVIDGYIQNLPFQINDLVKKIRFLEQKNAFLNQELQQRQQTISQLKSQIYSSVLKQTQSNLNLLQIIEEQTDKKVKQVHFFLNRKQIVSQKLKFWESQKECENCSKIKIQLEKVKQKLRTETKASQLLAQNVVNLKQYIFNAIEEKDNIIYELKSMVLNSHELQIPNQNQFCNKNIRKHSNQKRFQYRISSKDKYPDKQKPQKLLDQTKMRYGNGYKSTKTAKAKIIKNT